jgi:hypothetical protein
MLAFAVLAFTTIFSIVDPFAVVAPFLAMTAGDSGARRRAIALRARLVACGVLVLFAAARALVFDVFGTCVECPLHGAEFDLKTGKARTLPAVLPVPSYAVRVEGDAILVSAEPR